MWPRRMPVPAQTRRGTSARCGRVGAEAPSRIWPRLLEIVRWESSRQGRDRVAWTSPVGVAHSDFRLAVGLLSGGMGLSTPTYISLQVEFEMTQKGFEREPVVKSNGSIKQRGREFHRDWKGFREGKWVYLSRPENCSLNKRTSEFWDLAQNPTRKGRNEERRERSLSAFWVNSFVA
jgi:hypothetical protein